MFYLPLGILVLTEAASLYLKGRCFGIDRSETTNNIRIYKYLFLFSVILILGWACFQSYQQYQIFSASPISKFFLPPHQSIAYFLKYSFTHFFKNYLISLGAGLLFLWLANLLNHRYQKRFFEEEELYLGALAIFIMGQPLWMIYFIAVMSVGVLGTLFFHVSCFMFHVSSRRFPFYYLWLPVAILVLIIGKILV
ncbi:MAG: hypothetical protein Q8N22_02715 [bacterium]|nr:hypothetical protein [bacterium]